MQVKAQTSKGLLFETSWEVCNKIGGIYTVLSTKAQELKERYEDNLIFIGPDVWSEENPSPYFKENKNLLKKVSGIDPGFGIRLRTGRWDVPGSPIVVLVDFKGVYPHLNDIYGKMWEKFGVDSLHAYGDYDESCAFAIASALAIKAITDHLNEEESEVIAHFDEWTTGMGLLYLKTIMPTAHTVFTTHATSIGRSICGNGKALYEYFEHYNGDQMARELNMEAKHSLEKAAAANADCFTTVSEVTARECTQLLGVTPDVVTPNGFEQRFVPEGRKAGAQRRQGRKKLLEIAGKLTGKSYNGDTMIIATSGRNEYRNKGIDLFLDSMAFLEEYTKNDDQQIVAFILVPAWVKEPNGSLLANMKEEGNVCSDNFLTHSINNPDSDAIACRIRGMQAEGKLHRLNVIYVPCYLDGHDGIIDIAYYDLLPALDATVFDSYYEPWGYTPLESVAFGVPTVTTDKAGFGQWALTHTAHSLEKAGVEVIERNDHDYELAMQQTAGALKRYMMLTDSKKRAARKAAQATAALATWSKFIEYYDKAYSIAKGEA